MNFVIRPGDFNPALRTDSRNFIQARVSEAQYQVRTFEDHLTKAYAMDDDTDFGDQRIADAESNYQLACAHLASSRRKLAFEDRDIDRPRVKPKKGAMPEPWKNDPDKWKNIFRYRNNRDF